METLKQLIAQEQAKLSVLEQEVANRRQRIAMLQGMLSDSVMDQYLASKASKSSTHPRTESQQQSAMLAVAQSAQERLNSTSGKRPGIALDSKASWPFPQGSVVPALDESSRSDAVDLFAKPARRRNVRTSIYLVLERAQTDLHLSKIKERLHADGMDIPDAGIRSALFALKNQGLVESPKNGIFRVLDKKGEAPGGSKDGDPRAEGFNVQPSPQQGSDKERSPSGSEPA